MGPPHGHQQPTTDSGGSDGPGGGPRHGGGGGGWWRPEDPYWPLREWGDHPMRWWAFGLAAVLAGEDDRGGEERGAAGAIRGSRGVATARAMC